MGRPCKAMVTKSGAMSKEQAQKRIAAEKAISGGKDKILKASPWLTKDQKKIRKQLCQELEKVLTNVDCYILEQCAVAIDRLQKIEQAINEKPEKVLEKSLLAAKKEYTSTFFRCCSELSMSPQSRAKIANAMTEKQVENPLLKLLNDDE